MGASIQPAHWNLHSRRGARMVLTDRGLAGQAYNPRTGTYAQTRQGSNVYGNWGTSSVQRGDNWAQIGACENYRTGHDHGRRSDERRRRRRYRPSGPAGNSGASFARLAATSTPDVMATCTAEPTVAAGSKTTAPAVGTRSTVRAASARRRVGRRPAIGRPQAQVVRRLPRPPLGRAGGSQVGQLEGDRGARDQGNTRTSDRGSWERSGSTRSGAGSYGGSRAGGGASRGGGRRR